MIEVSGPELVQYGAGVAALIVAIGAWAKLKAHNSAAGAESDLYDNLRQENDRLAMRLSETSVRLDGEIDAHRAFKSESDQNFNMLRRECEDDRKELNARIRMLESRLDDLYESINKFKQAEKDAAEITAKVICGDLPDCRTPQPPRGRRKPPTAK